jgi:hypothetical protein
VASTADRVVNLFDGMIADDAAVSPAPFRAVGTSGVLELRD